MAAPWPLRGRRLVVDVAVPRRQFYVECFEELIDGNQMLDEEQLEWAQVP